METETKASLWVVLALAVLLADGPVVGAVQSEVVQDTQAERLVDLVQAVPLENLDTSGADLPGTRAEADGSVTVLGPIEDEAGPLNRTEVPLEAVPGADGYRGGTFTRSWTDGTYQVLTVGLWLDDGSVVRNLNLFALEGQPGVEETFLDLVEHDGVPILLNTLPFVLNYAQPTSLVLTIALALGLLAVAVAAGTLADAGQGELAAITMDAYTWAVFSPLFYLNVLYPVHTDKDGEETYRDRPDVFVWDVIKEGAGQRAWHGSYLQREGHYAERSETGSDGSTHLIAEAWKRMVTGPASRALGETVKHPGLYLRQDIHRDMAVHADGSQRFEAENRLTSGLYDPQLGESPGVTVHMDETKEGSQTFLYAPHQQDTIALGVTVEDRFVPLVGTRTESWHRPYTDTTNQGSSVAAIESYRVTSVGPFVGDGYVPAWGVDVWTERLPLDLWALTFALSGPGDQLSGDLQARTGVFVDGRFVAVAGLRVDDDFQGHRHTYRTMVSAGLFVADPTDPGDGTPGESPDDARFVPLVGTTYDGATPATLWALSNVADDPGGMRPFLVSAGTFVLDEYAPLVGASYAPGAYQGQRRAQETYQVGIFPADYTTFVPLVGVTYDGDHTTAAFAQASATSHAGMGGDRGQADTSQGAYVADDYVPLTGVRYRPDGTASHPMGDTVRVGLYGPDGAFVPLVDLVVAFDAPPTSWGDQADTCRVHVSVTLVPLGQTVGQTPPCIPM